MHIRDLDYDLPEAAIAQQPLPERAQARLLVVRPGGFEHHTVAELARLIPERALLVLNDTRVRRARLHARKESGGRVEVLLLRCIEERGEASHWDALLSANRPLRIGAVLHVGDARLVVSEGPNASGVVRLELWAPTGYEALLKSHGHVPLPPYIRRPDTAADESRYQTVFARVPGSAAAPTAGLHLTQEILVALERRGVEIEFVTLHVGGGTFLPVRVEELSQHPMHEETVEVRKQLATAVQRAKADGRPVVAVGTTVMRALESAAQEGNGLREGSFSTRLLIQPGYRFRAVTSLLTNFHAPRSTLLALVAACVGRQRWRETYGEALASGYRFLSYGDAMWIPDLVEESVP